MPGNTHHPQTFISAEGIFANVRSSVNSVILLEICDEVFIMQWESKM